MIGADTPIQIALRARLTATPAVTGLVPAASILDAHERPAPRPSVILGQSSSIDVSTFDRLQEIATHTLHIWTEEPSTEGCKGIVAAIVAAIKSDRLDLGPGLHCVDWRVTLARVFRDPDGVSSHGVIDVQVHVQRVPI